MDGTKKKRINIHFLDHGKGLPLPVYKTPGSSGADLFAAVNRNTVIGPKQRELIPTGIIVEIPRGMEMQIRPRSGLAFKNGITVLNTPGTVDSDYRGEIKVILYNSSETPFTVERGMRIAQGVFVNVQQVEFASSDVDPSETDRGSGGFGHTGA